MNSHAYTLIRDFFSTYTKRFVQAGDEPEPFILKIAHTRKVVANISILARELGLDPAMAGVARSAALLHDIGRFPQYKRHHTFNDRVSENHGALGAQVLREKGVLDRFNTGHRQAILKAVAHHNAFALPGTLDEETRLLARMVRDADKIDIFRVMGELYRGSVPGQTSFITHHLPDDGKISNNRVQDILNHRLVAFKEVETLNDMKLFQISWIFDLNFRASLDLVRERGLISTVLDTMPKTREMGTVASVTDDFLKQGLIGSRTETGHYPGLDDF